MNYPTALTMHVKGGFMKKTMNALFIFICVFILASSAFADNKAKSFSIAPFIGGYTFDSKEDLKTRPVSGIRLGYDFTPHWALEGVFEYIPTIFERAPVIESPAYALGYRLEALYNFMPEKRLVPYIAVGAGGRSLQFKDFPYDRNHAAVDYGLGLKYFLYSDM